MAKNKEEHNLTYPIIFLIIFAVFTYFIGKMVFANSDFGIFNMLSNLISTVLLSVLGSIGVTFIIFLIFNENSVK